MGTPLDPIFYRRDTLSVTRDLLGKNLCRERDGQIERLPITEVEAYDGPDDEACHAYQRKTPRNAIMFGPGGHWYVYLCYGVHWLLNIVVGPDDYPAAALIRGAGPHVGPGRLTKALAVGKAENTRLAEPATGLWIEDAGIAVPESVVYRGPRIGIDSAGPHWANVPYRMIWRAHGHARFKPPRTATGTPAK